MSKERQTRRGVMGAAFVAALLAALLFPIRPASADVVNLLYGADGGQGNSADLYQLDPADGSVVENIGPTGFSVRGMAMDPTTGILYGTTSGAGTSPGSLITIDTDTGDGTLVGDLQPSSDETVVDLAFTADGTLYGWLEPTSDDLVTIDKETGEATVVGDSGLSTFGGGTAADAAGTIWLAGEGEAGNLHTIDKDDGSATSQGTLDGDATDDDPISSLSFSCDDVLHGVRVDNDASPATTELLTIDTSTAEITSLGASVDNLTAIAFACPGSVELSSTEFGAAEQAGEAIVTVVRVDGAQGTVSVDFATADGTAEAGSDYTATSGTLTFAHGETEKSFSVPIADDDVAEGNETFTVALSNPVNTIVSAPASGTVTIMEDVGYRMVAADGGIFTFGERNFHGSTGDIALNEPIVGGATRGSDFDGYWIVARDGGVFAFNAEFHGSLANETLSASAVEIEPTPTGKGYWIVLADGTVRAFGDAEHFDDMSGETLNQPIIGMTVTVTGKGYWLVAEDGGIFTFGDAEFHGSMGGQELNAPVIDLGPAPDGEGYYLLGADGGVFSFGTAVFHGSTGAMKLNQPVVAMLVRPNGYWLGAADGGVFTFGGLPFLGSMGAVQLNAPVLDMID